MHVTWTSRLWKWVAAVGAGGACWAALIGVSVSQTISSDTTQSTQSTQTGQSQSGQAGSTQSGQSGTTQQGTPQRQSRSDLNRQGRDDQQGTQDAIGQPRDDMRRSSRSTRDQERERLDGARYEESDERASATRDEYGNQRQRSFDRDSDRSQSRDQGQRGLDQSQRRFSRDFDRDDFRDQQGQRDFDRDDFRNQQGQQGRRDFSRESDRDQFGTQGRQGQRDFSRDTDRDQFSDRRQSGRDERDFQGGRFDQRGTGQQAMHTQITRGADVGLWFERGHRNALVISDIANSGPITRFGFREGDQIMSVNGQRVSTEQQFINTLVSPQFANQRIPVVLWRNGQQVAIYVEPWLLTQNVRGAGHEQQADQLEQFGIVLDDRYQAPVVWKVTPRSPAYYAGLRGNDVIVAWNNQHVNDPEELE